MNRCHPLATLRWICRFLFFILWLSGPAALALQDPGRIDSSAGSGNDEPWKITLVDPDEPGLPMVVTGVVFAPDGITPVSGITVHAYHTDERGFYSKDGRNEGQHRIKGDMITNERGQFEFSSIKPASYPNSRVPSHVHFIVTEPGFVSQRFNLEFKGDPHLSLRRIEQSEKDGRFAAIRPLIRDENGVLRCTYHIRLKR